MEGEGGAPNVQSRWTNQAVTRLRAKFQPPGIPGGLGFIPPYYASPTLPAPALITGSPTNAAYLGPGGRGEVLSTSGQSIEWVVFGTSVDVCFANTVNGGATIQCSIDGGTAVNITNPGASSAVDMTTSRQTFTARGWHTVTISISSGSAYIDGIIVYDGDETAGIRTYDGSHLGWSTIQFAANLGTVAGFAATPLQQQCATIQPNAVFIELGANDFLGNTNPSGSTTGATTMLTNLEAFITQIRAGCTVPPVIVIVVCETIVWTQNGNTGTAPEPLSDFFQELYALVASDPLLALCDLSLRFPYYGNDTQSLYWTDDLHPSAKGALYLGEIFADWITGNATVPAVNPGPGPSDFGAYGWSVDPATCTQTIKPSSGVMMLARVRATRTGSVGHISYQITTAGATLTSGDNFVGIYDTGQTTPGTATLLEKSADQHTIWQTAGIGGSAGAPTALTTAASVVAGQDYLVAWLAVGTTPPTFAAGGALALANTGLAGSQLRFATEGSALTALPTSFTMSSAMTALAASPIAVLLP